MNNAFRSISPTGSYSHETDAIMYVFMYYEPLGRLDMLEMKLTRDGLIPKKDWYSLQTIKQWKLSGATSRAEMITEAVFQPSIGGLANAFIYDGDRVAVMTGTGTTFDHNVRKGPELWNPPGTGNNPTFVFRNI